METRRKDQPVSITLAIGRPANPRARDPPSPDLASHLPVRSNEERGDAPTSPLPKAGRRS
jgi:hypothetical protein